MFYHSIVLNPIEYSNVIRVSRRLVENWIVDQEQKTLLLCIIPANWVNCSYMWHVYGSEPGKACKTYSMLLTSWSHGNNKTLQSRNSGDIILQGKYSPFLGKAECHISKYRELNIAFLKSGIRHPQFLCLIRTESNFTRLYPAHL